MVLILAKECQKECVDGRHLGTSTQNDKFCITELNKRCYKDIEKGNEIRVIAERKFSKRSKFKSMWANRQRRNATLIYRQGNRKIDT